MPLPHLGIDEEVRVCDGCHVKLKIAKAARKGGLPPLPFSPQTQAQPASQSVSAAAAAVAAPAPAPAAGEDEFDDDMKRAIEMSLKEEEQRKGFGKGYTPSQPAQPVQSSQSTPVSTSQVNVKKRASKWFELT